LLCDNQGTVALGIITSTTNLKVIVSSWQPKWSAKRAIATDEMKQIARDEEVALEFIVRGFVRQSPKTSSIQCRSSIAERNGPGDGI
jgi:hypothetical protein